MRPRAGGLRGPLRSAAGSRPSDISGRGRTRLSLTPSHSIFFSGRTLRSPDRRGDHHRRRRASIGSGAKGGLRVKRCVGLSKAGLLATVSAPPDRTSIWTYFAHARAGASTARKAALVMRPTTARAQAIEEQQNGWRGESRDRDIGHAIGVRARSDETPVCSS